MNKIINLLGGGTTLLSPIGGYLSYKNLENHVLTIVFLLTFILSVAVLITNLINKYGKTKCETCKQPMRLLNKTSVGQEEVFRKGQFVFLHTYQYHYHCEHCDKDVDIIKKKN
ncbi:MAG: hypothetical protein RBQ91_04565 [Acholeplasma sp.]|nr:hypothetical protein [Acholeplasma sp.]